MRKALAILFLFITLAPSISAQKSEEGLVRKAFDNYKSAILQGKGEEAVRFVDSKTEKYYGDVLDWVKNADSATVVKLPILDRFMTFIIRYRVSKEQVMSFDARSLLIYAVDNGMIGKNSVAKNSIGEVTISQTKAKGQFLNDGKKTPLSVEFNNEQGQWKVDLTSLFGASSQAFKALAGQSGQDENAYLFSVLEMLGGKAPGPEIWHPMK